MRGVLTFNVPAPRHVISGEHQRDQDDRSYWNSGLPRRASVG